MASRPLYMCYFQLNLHSVADRRTEMTSSYMKHRPFVELLCISHPIQQQALLNSASHEQIRFLQYVIAWKTLHILKEH